MGVNDTPDPSSPTTISPLPGWPAAAYAGAVDGPGAEKLADSAVAPLVAAARGYRHVDLADVPAVARRLRTGATNTRRHRSLVDIVEQGGGAMLMPRYRAEAGFRYREGAGQAPFVDIAEFKPVFPLPDPTDPTRTLKYKSLTGDTPVLDVHPATPTEWVEHSRVVLITEGILKGDSGLTAVLRWAGAADAELAAVPDSQAEATDRLRSLLRAVPAEQRVLIISLGGVANWHHQTEWNNLNLTGRVAWLAFDGDVGTNRQVWNQAGQLWRHLQSKRADPRWLDLPVAATGADGKPDRGLDDYLSKIGPWPSLPRLLKPALPPAPPVAAGARTPNRGDLRVNDIDGTVEIAEITTDSRGNPRSTWRTHAGIAGRIVTLVELRSASDEEIATGNRSQDPADCTDVTLELTWIDPADGVTRRTATVSGPDAILAESPGEWHKPRVGAAVPSAVKAHPDWPCDLRWLQAVKGHRREEIAASVRWQHMGWVPTDTPGEPAFIVGRQVIDRTGFCDRVQPGVTDRVLDGAGMFGVSRAADDDELRDALRDVIATYTHAWRRDPRQGAATLAAALRPTVPRTCVTPVTLIGQRGTAKALPLDAPIPVPLSDRFPDGWARNADLRIGDRVYAPDGTATAITSFSDPVAGEPMIEFTLSDGQKVRSTAGHLWRVSTSRSRGQTGFRVRRRPGLDERRRQDAVRLREMAQSIASDVGATIEDIARLTGLNRGRLDRIIRGAGLPNDRGLIPAGPPREMTVWPVGPALAALVDARRHPGVARSENPALTQRWLPCSEILSVGLGRVPTKPEKDCARMILESTQLPSRLSHRLPLRPHILYPVAESLLVIANAIEINPSAAPLESVRTAAEIADVIHSVRGIGFGIRATAPIEPGDDPSDLPVPGYVLGAWLGDGTTREGGITCPDLEVIDRIRAHGYTVNPNGSCAIAHYIRGLSPQLRRIGVLGDKHIPAAYLRASTATRLEVLRGLMDTDGTASSSGAVAITVTNRRLAESILELLRSLGVRAAISVGSAVAVSRDPDSGERIRKDCGPAFRLHFTPSFEVFHLPRKLERQRVRLDRAAVVPPRWLTIVSAVQLPPQAARCVSVAHPSGQFLAFGFVPTHNSWSAAAAMYFWQARPGSWSANRLPGSAGDTAASIEIALSRTPIWVVDDLAPGPDEQEEKREAAKLGKVIRAVFNRTGKRRATVEMRSAATHSPRAQLILTGENHRFSTSAESRYVLMEFTLGSLDDEWMQRLDALGKHTTKMSMITFAVLRMLAAGSYRVDFDGTPMDPSWVAVMDDIAQEYRSFETAAEVVLGVGNKRAAGTAADLCLGLWALEQLCRQVDLPELSAQVYGMRDQVISLVAQHLSGQSERTPGRAALGAVRAALASGQAHIAATDTPGSAPVIGRSDSALIASRLGWLADGDGNLRAGGQRVGYLVRAVEDDPVILLDPENAFHVAARANRQLVMFGSTAREAWKSAWAEGLTCPDGAPYTRAKDRDGRARLTVRAQVGGTQVSGVPFRLSALLDDS